MHLEKVLYRHQSVLTEYLLLTNLSLRMSIVIQRRISSLLISLVVNIHALI